MLVFLKLAFFIAVVGGCVAGLVFATRIGSKSKALKGLRKDIQALDAGRELFSEEEYEEERSKIRTRCLKHGVNPDHL